MLLITGKHSERLPNISMIATKAHLQLLVADRGTVLTSLLAKNRRNMVVLDEADLTDDMTTALAGFAGEPNLKVMIVCTAARPTAESKSQLKRLEGVIWLTPETRTQALQDLITQLRDEMLSVTHDELDRAFRQDELRLRYQPKVTWIAAENRWDTREVESLVRWRHPEHGLLSPRHFLPEIEQFGYMERLTDWVLEATLKQLKAFEQNDWRLGGCINVAPTMLDLTGLARRYRGMVLDYGLSCDRICFELPTSGVLQRSEQRAKVVQKLRDAGFRVALDDFGAESNAMRVFEVLEFDEIKIHASLLQEGCRDASILKSLSALTGLARNLEISVCGEGVETEEMFGLLQEIHCDKMQGYLVSEAVMPDIIQKHYAGSNPVSVPEEPGAAHLM